MIVFVNYPFDVRDREAEALLARYRTLVGWARAVAGAGGGAVAVVQRFGRDARLRREGVEYRFVADAPVERPPPWWWSLRAVDAVAALDPDVVHVHGLVYPVQVRLLRARLPARTALLVQDHGGIHAGSAGFGRRAWRALHRFGLRAADGFLFSTGALARPWQDAGIIGPEQPIYDVAESSTDLADRAPQPSSDRDPADSSRQPDAPPPPTLPPPPNGLRAIGDPALLWVGRLDANKDPLTVLAAFERVLAQLPGAALTMVLGEGELLARVRARIAAVPALARKVQLAGPLPQEALPALYAGADLFVLGSHHEGSGYALIEALAFGVTPVVTDIPSFRALTAGGALGALFPAGDAEACARAIVRLALPEQAQKQARRKEIAAHFARELGWPALGARASSIYRAAAKGRVRRAGIATGHF